MRPFLADCWFRTAIRGLLIFSAARASCASFMGKVVGPSDAPVPHAQVALGSSTAEADSVGTFSFSDLKPGTYTLVISAVGYAAKSITVNLDEQEQILTVTLDENNPVLLDRVTITGSTASVSIASEDKANSASNKEIVSGSALTRNGAQDASDGLKGVSGVTVNRTSDGSTNVAIRGLAQQFNRVTVDGQRQSNSGRFSSGSALDSLPPEILKSIEVVKALTPDLDADAIGGIISVATANASELKKPMLQVKESLAIESIKRRTGVRSSVTAGYPFRLRSVKPNAGILVTIAHDDIDRVREQVETTGDWPSILSPGPSPWTGTAVPVFTRANLQQTVDHRKRTALLVSTDVRTGDSSFYLKYNYTKDQILRDQSNLVFDVAEGQPLSLSDNYAAFSGVHLTVQGVDRTSSRTTHTVSIGSKTETKRLQILTNAGISRAVDRLPNGIFADFISKDPYTITLDTRADPLLPRITTASNPVSPNTSRPLAAAGYALKQFFVLDNVGRDTNYNAQVDIKTSPTPGQNESYLKFGSKILRLDRNADDDRFVYQAHPEASAPSLDALRSRPVTLTKGAYHLGPIPEPHRIQALLESQPGFFDLDQVASAVSSHAADYTGKQTIWAGYGMGQLKRRDWSIIAGVRAEGTQVSTTASPARFAEDGRLLGFESVSSRKHYVDLLPGIHLRYDAAPGFIVRLSVNRTLTRPDLGEIAPYRLVNYPLRTTYVGNPDLDPYKADNFDFSIDSYREGIGLLSASLYYKSIRNFQVESWQTVTLGGLGDFLQIKKINGETATVAGAELAWRSRFFPLACLGSKFNLAATYNFGTSTSEVPTRPREKFSLPLQARNQFSVSLRVERKTASVDLRVSYRSKVLVSIVSPERDQYEKGTLSVDLNGTIKVRKNISLSLGARNLSNAGIEAYVGNPSRLKLNQSNGIESFAGLEWKL